MDCWRAGHLRVSSPHIIEFAVDVASICYRVVLVLTVLFSIDIQIQISYLFIGYVE